MVFMVEAKKHDPAEDAARRRAAKPRPTPRTMPRRRTAVKTSRRRR